MTSAPRLSGGPVWTSRPSESNTRTAPNSASTGSLKRSVTCPGAASRRAPRSGVVASSRAWALAACGSRTSTASAAASALITTTPRRGRGDGA